MSRTARRFRSLALTILAVAVALTIAAADEQAKKIDAEPVLLQGAHAGEAVCAWAADEGCDLLVAAPHSGRLRRTTVGSFAGYVSVHAPCSVLLARGTLPASASVPS